MNNTEPKNGEWWLCELDSSHPEYKEIIPMLRQDNHWWNSNARQSHGSITLTPLHRLFIQGDNITAIEDAEDVISRVQVARINNQRRMLAAINCDDALWLVAGDMLDQAQAEIDHLKSLPKVTKLPPLLPVCDKSVLVNAIIGKGFLSMEDAIHWEKLGFAETTGNQHNYDWKWIRARLDDLNESELRIIYNRRLGDK